MTSKERVITTLARREPDRVPINYAANEGIDQRLKRHFGLELDDAEGLRQALGVDFRRINAPDRGPKQHEDIPERGVRVDNWGVHRCRVEHDTGGYWDFCDFPLRDADEETVANWPMPSPDDHDYTGVREACERHRDYGIHIGSAGLGCIINTAGFFRGMEQAFVDLATDEPAGLLLIDRFLQIQLEVARRTLEAAPPGAVDFMWMGEDLGTQDGPLISMEMFQKHILPRHKPFYELAAAYDLPEWQYCKFLGSP